MHHRSIDSCCASDQEGVREEELELGSVDTACSGSSAAAVLIAKLQRSQNECEAWQRHAELLAKRLTVERWQRAGTTGSDGIDGCSGVEKRRLHQKQEEIVELAAQDGTSPNTAAAEAAQLLEDALHIAADKQPQPADFKFPGRSGSQVQALVARGAAGGWLIAPEEIKLGALLGDGAFGETFRARWHGADVAVKRVRIDSDVELASFLREVECLSGLRHPSIVPFLGAVIQDAGSCWLVSEYMPGGTLEVLLHGAKPGSAPANANWPLSERLERALEIATALAALEACEPAILHRDIKPSNVLVDGAGRARMSDFGLARRKPRSEAEGLLTGETGTYLYMAPEIMRHEDYGPSADVWSFGVMMFEIITRQKPYSHTFMTPVQIALAVSGDKLRPNLPAYLPANLAKVVNDCCDFDATKRPSFSVVVRALEAIIPELKSRESKAPKRGPSFLRCFSLTGAGNGSTSNGTSK